MINFMRMVMIFLAMVFICGAIFTVFCYFTDNTDLLPPFLQPNQQVEAQK